MRRDVLLLEQMIEAAEQAVALVHGVAVQELAVDRIRRDALLWNFTVLGEASATRADEGGQAAVGAAAPTGCRSR